MGRMTSRIALFGALAACCAAWSATPARADAIDTLSQRVLSLRTESDNLRQGIKPPSKTDKEARDKAERRLIDGQVAFGVGNYDDAAVMLYDYVEQYPDSPSHDEAVYYLAESLFQKRDLVASRSFFTKLVTEIGPRSKFYQQGLERLLELSLELRDSENVDQWLTALENVPAGKRRASVPYVRGKYEYFKERFDDALAFFAQVPAGSEYFLRARYFMGTTHVSRGDLGQAAKIFEEIIRSPAESAKEKRVVELAHMSLGRLYYERDQPSKAIDEYTAIERESDLFDEALFEVAWVYVKDNQYDKALRALELLALADPSSAKMPEVRILEGNLRIRKAQKTDGDEAGNSTEEYEKARQLFESTHEAYKDPHDELKKIIDARTDPRAFMAQITGRHSDTFAVDATMPEIAASWVRAEPEVERLVTIETDLGDISDDIGDAEGTIDRLERALASPARVNIFPQLARKRIRATEILEELFGIRRDLIRHERVLVLPVVSEAEKAEMDKRMRVRQKLDKEFRALPDADVAYSERVERARGEFVRLDQQAAEVATVIDTSRATLVALERYVESEKQAGRLPGNEKETQKVIDELHAEIEAMTKDLEELRRATLLAQDEAGTGDEVAQHARSLRAELDAALAAEHEYLATFVPRVAAKNRGKADKIAASLRTAQEITRILDSVQDSVDEIVEFALTDVRASLADEKARLSAYKREFVEYEAESRVLGGAILEVSFRVVKDKLYDVVIRSDIGVIDVSWARKEAIDELAARLGLDRLRELRTLREEFRDVIDEGQDSGQ